MTMSSELRAPDILSLGAGYRSGEWERIGFHGWPGRLGEEESFSRVSSPPTVQILEILVIWFVNIILSAFQYAEVPGMYWKIMRVHQESVCR
jgi:hypothetical protein